MQQDIAQADNPQLLYEKLKDKWNMVASQELIIEEVNQEAKIKKLIAESKNRPIPKFLQIQKEYEQKTEDDTLGRNELSKNEEIPKALYQQLEDYPNSKIINIGQQWTDLIQQSTEMRYNNQKLAYYNFYWLQAKRGRLGVDLFAILFGIFGVAMVPMYFYQKTQRRQRNYRDEIKMVSGVEDWESSNLDIDDVSVKDSNYNLFTDEINAVMKKKLEIQAEIQKLLGRV